MADVFNGSLMELSRYAQPGNGGFSPRVIPGIGATGLSNSPKVNGVLNLSKAINSAGLEMAQNGSSGVDQVVSQIQRTNPELARQLEILYSAVFEPTREIGPVVS